MITDAAALGLALFADVVARRPPSRRASYGYGRAEVLAAFVNAMAMLAVVAGIAIEAFRRLLEPAPVAGGWVVGIANLPSQTTQQNYGPEKMATITSHQHPDHD